MQFITSGNRIAVENFTLGDLYTITFTSGIYINSACIGIGENFVSFQRNEPELLFTLNMETAELVSSIDLYAGGTGTNNYNELSNKPQIGGVELVGNKSLSDLGIQAEITEESPLSSSLVSGLGSAAAAESSDFATAAQGALAASAIQSAGTGLTKDGTTLNHSNSVTAQTSASFASFTYDAQGHITGSTAATTAQLYAINSGITSTDVAQIETNKTNILSKCVVCTCSTAAATAAKVVDAPQGFVLQEGCIIGVKFSYSNTATDVTLNVGGTGAKSIYYANSVYTDKGSKVTGYANYYIFYMYDGTYWVWVNYDFDGTYSTMTQAQASAGTDTTGRLIPAKVLSDTIDEKLVPVETNILALSPTTYTTPTTGNNITIRSGGYYKVGKSVTVCARINITSDLAYGDTVFSDLPIPVGNTSLAASTNVVVVANDGGKNLGINLEGKLVAYEAITTSAITINCTYLCT